MVDSPPDCELDKMASEDTDGTKSSVAVPGSTEGLDITVEGCSPDFDNFKLLDSVNQVRRTNF